MKLTRRSPAVVTSMRAALPGTARLEIIDGAGHFTWLDAPHRYWPMIIEFINRTTGPSAGER
jgi:pimeloyl-ACP methyl ester carboxylesterase